MRDRNLLFGIRWGVDQYDTQRLCGGYSSGLRGVAMRKITIELYANNEYALDERLKQIRWSINNVIWPSSCFSEGSRKRLESGCIEEETEYKLTDYEYDKENPNWRYGQRQDCVGKWKMQVVPDEEYVKFQESPDL